MTRFALLFSLAILAMIALSACGKKPKTATLTGAIIDERATTPVAGATVLVGGLSTISDASGSYSIASVPLGEASVTVSAPGYTSHTTTLTISGKTQTLNVKLSALELTSPFSVVLDPQYYNSEILNLGGYSFYHYNQEGMGTHNVRLTVQITSTPIPIYLALVRPDGKYDIEQPSVAEGFSQSIMTNACGNWALALRNRSNDQVTVSGRLVIDFSNYMPPSNDLSSEVDNPITYKRINPGSSVSFLRFMQANLTYTLNLQIYGGANNDINLDIRNTDGNNVFDQRVNNTYRSQRFVATKSGFYTFVLNNGFSIISPKSVTGDLVIAR